MAKRKRASECLGCEERESEVGEWRVGWRDAAALVLCSTIQPAFYPITWESLSSRRLQSEILMLLLLLLRRLYFLPLRTPPPSHDA